MNKHWHRILNRVLPLARQRETTLLADRQLVVVEGSARKSADYDDAWLLACALHSEKVFDLGANIGQSTLIMLLSPTIKDIVLVDPNSSALAIAADNLITNRLSACAHFVCAFVSDQANETVEFWTVGAGAAGSKYRTHAKTASGKNSSYGVPTITVDTLVTQFGYIPDFIKVDVEGAEVDVLHGARLCISSQQTRLMIEMHSNTQMTMKDNASRVLNWCHSTNYQAWYLRDKVQLTDATQVEDRGRCHLLLQPASWAFPDWLLSIEQSAPLTSAYGD